jgi:GNAT superfamily N-acetyltransferase
MGAPQPVRVRNARDDERETIRALTRKAYAEFATVMEPAAWEGLDGAVEAGLEAGETADRIVAERDGAIVGSVLLFPPASDAYGGATGRVSWPEIRLLAVDPRVRGQGVARAIMDECVRRARAFGSPMLGLHTSRSMRAARALYERMGFVRAPELDFQPEGAELVEAFRLDLRSPAPSGDDADAGDEDAAVSRRS